MVLVQQLRKELLVLELVLLLQLLPLRVPWVLQPSLLQAPSGILLLVRQQEVPLSVLGQAAC